MPVYLYLFFKTKLILKTVYVPLSSKTPKMYSYIITYINWFATQSKHRQVI